MKDQASPKISRGQLYPRLFRSKGEFLNPCFDPQIRRKEGGRKTLTVVADYHSCLKPSLVISGVVSSLRRLRGIIMEALVDRKQTSSTSSTQQQLDSWRRAQDSLRQQLVTQDNFAWQLPSSTDRGENEVEMRKEPLKYIGGVDISFSNNEVKEEDEENPSNSIACATLVVLEFPSLNVVYEDFSIVRPLVPYLPGFLAFREAPILLELLNKMKEDAHPFYPQLLMVDGNGLLHPRGFGLACHLGVLADLPTIGVGKNLHHVDGLDQSRVRKVFADDGSKECVDLIGSSGSILGMALRSAPGVSKPIYISIGHRVSLSTAVTVAKLTCKYRVPEPIRQADIRSRDYIRTLPSKDNKI